MTVTEDLEMHGVLSQDKEQTMAKYSDYDIRNMKKITYKIAGDYLGISPMAVSIGT